MKKNFLQDVIPANHKRSIRDIPLPKHRDGKSKSVQDPRVSQAQSIKLSYDSGPVITHTDEPFDNKEQIFDPNQFNAQDSIPYFDSSTKSTSTSIDKHFDTNKENPTKNSRKKKSFIPFLIIIIIGAGFLFGRTNAEISYVSKSRTHEVDVNIPINVSSSIAVPMQITKTQEITLEATSEQQVEKQASGRIKISNSYSENSQDLVKNTRFQTAEGLVYRIKDSIRVPGYKVVNGSNIPGTLEVEVYADSAGEEYNIGMTKFTIPGFSGMPQSDKIIAQSITEMKGGYIGIKKVVSEDAEDNAYNELKDKLEAELSSGTIISENQVVVPDLETISFGELVDEVNGNSVKLKLTATANAYQFDKMSLSDYIGRSMIAEASASDTFTIDPTQLNFTKDSDTIIVSGNTNIEWVTDIEALKKEIAGKKRSEIVNIISMHQSIERADISLKPFWKTKFPSDSSKIKVELTK